MNGSKTRWHFFVQYFTVNLQSLVQKCDKSIPPEGLPKPNSILKWLLCLCFPIKGTPQVAWNQLTWLHAISPKPWVLAYRIKFHLKPLPHPENISRRHQKCIQVSNGPVGDQVTAVSPLPGPYGATVEVKGCPGGLWLGPPAGSSPAVPASAWWWCRPSAPGRTWCPSADPEDTAGGLPAPWNRTSRRCDKPMSVLTLPMQSSF